MSAKRMPGPGFAKSVALQFDFKRNYIYPLEKLFREYGDYVTFTGGPPVVVAYHPDAVEHVLRANHKNYVKAEDMKELHPVLGLGLLTSEGEAWREHRRIIAPEFQHKNVESFYPIMTRHLKSLLAEWRTAKEVIDLAPALSKTTYGIAGETFFGANVEETSEVVYKGIEVTSAVAVRRMASPLKWPRWLPFPSHLRSNKAIKEMNEIVFRIIDERVNNPRPDAHDMLSRLTRVQLSREEIRDEVMTLLLAGHETTANALSWTLYLLGKRPKIQETLRDEVTAALADELPAFGELKNLRYTKMVFEESMRLFPPAATVGRQSLDADELGGYPIVKGTTVNLVQWVTHRHPEFWTEPNEFRPERFAKPEDHHPYAYFPFSAGPRECVGKNMAVVEGIALLAGLIRNFRFELAREEVAPRALITVRPDPGVFMRISKVPVGFSATRREKHPDLSE